MDEVLSTHILEHLKNDDVPLAMKAVYRVLKIGGVWNIEVPDLLWLFNDFLQMPEDQRWGWKLQTIFGMQNHEGEYHKTGFSDYRLGKMLKDTGFTRIKVDTFFSKNCNQGVIRASAMKL